jgi:hypothetical protein
MSVDRRNRLAGIKCAAVRLRPGAAFEPGAKHMFRNKPVEVGFDEAWQRSRGSGVASPRQVSEGGSGMANAGKKHFGKGTQGRGTGSGAMTELPREMVGENEVLSNRDKKLHSEERGQDGNSIKTEQEQDHSANRRP